MEKVIKIGDKDVPMKASAFTPFLFKNEYNEDLIKGMTELQRQAKDKELDVIYLSKVAYIMARSANESIGTLEEWLEQFEILDLYMAFPDIVGLWSDNVKQNAKPVKK